MSCDGIWTHNFSITIHHLDQDFPPPTYLCVANFEHERVRSLANFLNRYRYHVFRCIQPLRLLTVAKSKQCFNISILGKRQNKFARCLIRPFYNLLISARLNDDIKENVIYCQLWVVVVCKMVEVSLPIQEDLSSYQAISIFCKNIFYCQLLKIRK